MMEKMSDGKTRIETSELYLAKAIIRGESPLGTVANLVAKSTLHMERTGVRLDQCNTCMRLLLAITLHITRGPAARKAQQELTDTLRHMTTATNQRWGHHTGERR